MVRESYRLRPTVYVPHGPPLGRRGEDSGQFRSGLRSGSRFRTAGKLDAAGWPQRVDDHDSHAGSSRGSRGKH
jgi:hypothetical protein